MGILGSGRLFSLSSALLRGVASLEPAVPLHTGTQDLSLWAESQSTEHPQILAPRTLVGLSSFIDWRALNQLRPLQTLTQRPHIHSDYTGKCLSGGHPSWSVTIHKVWSHNLSHSMGHRHRHLTGHTEGGREKGRLVPSFAGILRDRSPLKATGILWHSQHSELWCQKAIRACFSGHANLITS